MTPEIPIEHFSVFASNLDHPECLAFDELYVANLARTTITRARTGRRGQPLANQTLPHAKT